ncbi:hypothetical protein AB4Z29_21015 [Paenibacillus sp. 2TAB23]
MRGIISKKLDSPYVEVKEHIYWFKKRKVVRIVAEARWFGVPITYLT